MLTREVVHAILLMRKVEGNIFHDLPKDVTDYLVKSFAYTPEEEHRYKIDLLVNVLSKDFLAVCNNYINSGHFLIPDYLISNKYSYLAKKTICLVDEIILVEDSVEKLLRLIGLVQGLHWYLMNNEMNSDLRDSLIKLMNKYDLIPIRGSTNNTLTYIIYHGEICRQFYQGFALPNNPESQKLNAEIINELSVLMNGYDKGETIVLAHGYTQPPLKPLVEIFLHVHKNKLQLVQTQATPKINTNSHNCGR